VTLHLVTNQPRRACLDLVGCWPPPAWLTVVSRETDVFDIPFDAPAFAMLYGDDVMRTPATDANPYTRGWRSPLARALDAYRDLRAADAAAAPFGLDAAELDRLRAFRQRRAGPGVVAAAVPATVRVAP
jgi:hypothetical protein